MDHKKSPQSRRTKRQSKALEENYWDCSVCTYRNTAEAFKCLMCDIRKGTSTRKPRINPQLVAQQVAQQFNPTPAKTHKREKSDKKSVNDRRSSKKKHHLRKLKNVDRNSAETREVTVNNITVMITEYKPKPGKKLVSDQSGQSSRASSESESSSEAPSAAADSDSRSSLLKVEQKLMKTTKKIQKTRKNTKLAEKEAAEFEEIRKLLSISLENDEITESTIPLTDSLDENVECSTIPFHTPWLTIFKNDLLFSLFDEETIRLSDFIDKNDELINFEGNDSALSEKTFRLLISSRFIESFTPENGKYPKISLYVLYLMSVHSDPQFVDACHDFLKFRPFLICPVDVLTIFRNWGADVWNNNPLIKSKEERLLRKFSRTDGNLDKVSRSTFPFHNVEAIGQILIDYVTNDLVEFSEDLKTLISLFGRILLDETIRSGHLTPIYSTLLTILCSKITKAGALDVNDISNLLDFREENPILRSEICQVFVRFIYPELRDVLILKTISGLLKCEDLLRLRSIQIDEIKLILQKCKRHKTLIPLAFYCILQLLTSSLPHLTATPEDSVEINIILNQLDQKINQTDDSVDRIRLKRELAKMKNLIANDGFDRFIVNDS